MASESNADLRIENRKPDTLTLRATNPRTHSKQQIRQIADSIEEFGFTNPVLIDASGTVIAGHGRVHAANVLGLEQVPTIQLEHLSEAQVRAYVIADNKLAENAGWDRDLLALELQDLAEIDLGFGLEVTGFETAELDLLIGGDALDAEADPADVETRLDADGPTVSRAGDLWQIGHHRLLCADALDESAYARALGGDRAQAVFVDPPYNVPINGHVSGLGRIQHDEFAMASGEMTPAEFTTFLESALRHHTTFSRPGALHFVCMDWRHARELIAAGDSVYSECKNICIWAKTNAGMGSLYRSQHEFVFVFKHGTAPHVNNVELGRHGRTRSNVWRYAGVNSFGAERDGGLGIHPTVKPVRLVADAILDSSRRGDIILDGFAGSGTTLLAAERTGRAGVGLEIEPLYVDAALHRLEEHAGLKAVHVESGLAFDEVAASRSTEPRDPDPQTGPDGKAGGDAPVLEALR
ncbi:MAG: DNA methylase N-4 [Deltaproteobacteria bacterium]|nr:DNA methylase N-4 [Deltaproteobacteria bacterium]